MTVAELWRRGQAGWPRRFPVVQFPNPPLLVALAARGASGVDEGGGPVAAARRSLFVVGIGMWAWEELAQGANWFRRLVCVAGLAWVLRFALGSAGPRPRQAPGRAGVYPDGLDGTAATIRPSAPRR
jgi:hypothetical protein